MIYMYKNIVNLKRSLLKIVLIMNVTGVLVFFSNSHWEIWDTELEWRRNSALELSNSV